MGKFQARLPAGSAASRAARRVSASWVPGVCIASAAAALFGNGAAWRHPDSRYPWPLVELRRSFYADPAVERIAPGEFHALELDPAGDTLYASSHRIPRLRAYDLADLEAPPREASVNTGGAEDFAYDSDGGELYVYAAGSHRLLVLDAATLGLRRSFAVPGLAPGDTALHWNAENGELFILSEADEQSGFAFVAADPRTGAIRRRLVGTPSVASRSATAPCGRSAPCRATQSPGGRHRCRSAAPGCRAGPDRGTSRGC